MGPLHPWPSLPSLFARTGKVGLCLIPVFAGFAQSPRTPSELMQRVLKAMERNDQQALKALAITKSEFRKFVWPSLSRTLPKLGINADNFYAMSVKESEIGLASTLKEFGGRKWEVLDVAPLTVERHPIRRKRFDAFSGPAITIRDESGHERTVHVVGGVMEFGGVYKVSTYSLAPDQK